MLKKLLIASILAVFLFGIMPVFSLSTSFSQPAQAPRGLFLAIDSSCAGLGSEPHGECRDCPGGGSVYCNAENYYFKPDGCDACNGDCTCTYQGGGGDCSSDPSKTPDCSWKCNNPAYVMDYGCGAAQGSYSCCPSNFPFHDGVHCSEAGSYCWTTPQPNSDNYYTRKSTCKPGQTECRGNTYYECKETSEKYVYSMQSSGIIAGKCNVECSSGEKCIDKNYNTCENYVWVSKGAVKGKCGVNCVSNSECSNTKVPVSEKYCFGNNIMQKFKGTICKNYICDSGEEFEEIVEACGYKCVSGACINCDEGALKCQGSDLMLCQNNQYTLKEKCQYGCSGDKCSSFPWFIIVLPVVFLGILGGGGFLVYKFFFKRR